MKWFDAIVQGGMLEAVNSVFKMQVPLNFEAQCIALVHIHVQRCVIALLNSEVRLFVASP